MQFLGNELVELSRRVAGETVAAPDGTLASIRANTTLAPSSRSCTDCWLDAAPLARRRSTGPGDTLVSSAHDLAQLGQTLNSSPASYLVELEALSAVKAQIAQIHALRRQLDPAATSLGRLWHTATSMERRALTAKERLNLACDGQKEPVADAIIVYLTQLRNAAQTTSTRH